MPRTPKEPRVGPSGTAPSTGLPRLRADARRNRRRVLYAAMRLFSRHGLEVPLEQIAGEAGVGIATLYRHFSSREALVRAVVEASLETIADKAAEVIDSGGEPMMALRSLLAYGAELHTIDRVLVELWRTVDNEVAMEAVRSTGLYDSTRQLLDDARAAGAVRDDVTVDDIARIFQAIAGVVEAGNGRAWRRVLELHLRAMASAGPALPDLVDGPLPPLGGSGDEPPYNSPKLAPTALGTPSFSRAARKDHMSAILFGSIGTIADTSEAQRQAFNSAFDEHDVGWHWDRDDYRAMLEESGGQNRIATFARSLGQEVDAEAIHRTKSEHFQRILAGSPPAPRRGVVDTVRTAKSNGIKVALVTTTSDANVASLLDAMGPHLQKSDFDLVVDTTSVDKPKPDRAAYVYALDRLAESSSDCIAIEDNRGGVQAAAAAGLRCIAFPNQNTADHTFEGAHGLVDAVEFADLRQLISSQ